MMGMLTLSPMISLRTLMNSGGIKLAIRPGSFFGTILWDITNHKREIYIYRG